jgi:type II secretory pathway pseudopilin PulG
VAIPVAILVFSGGGRLYRSVKQSPARFCGLRYARMGYVSSAVIPVVIAFLIAITLPVRLEGLQLGRDAVANAQGYTIARALREYQNTFGRLPNELGDLRQLPDPDNSIAAALNALDISAYPNAYKPSADVAVLPKQKPRPIRGAIIRNASLNNPTDDALADGLSFTNYELRLPGVDKLMGTDDDLIVSDGVITKVSENPRQAGAKNLP